MRIGIISDIHANLIALEDVLNDLDALKVDKILCLGDITTLGPSPVETIELLMEREIDCVLGNHDEFMINPAKIKEYTSARPIINAVDWARNKLSKHHLGFISDCKPTIDVLLPSHVITLCHGSPKNHMHNILHTTSSGRLDKMLFGCKSDVIIAGHTHIQMLRQYNGRYIVNPGSVGLPFKKFTDNAPPEIMIKAEFAIIENYGKKISFTLCHTLLDSEKLHKAAAVSGNPFCKNLIDHYTSKKHYYTGI